MIPKRTIFCFGVVIVCFLSRTICFAGNSETSEAEMREYKQNIARVEALERSFEPGPVNDLKKYEKFADEIQNKWGGKNKEHYANLMLEICKPLSSGRFNEDRQFILARKYALLALMEPNQISLETELELVGHVISDMATPRAPTGQEWAHQRKKDVEIRLHAWKRLIAAIDPNWDPNEEIWSPNAVGALMGLPSGIAPEGVKDPKLRAEYETALEKNKQDIERYTKQYRLHDWLRRFPRQTEGYIVRAYSKPPFNLEELKQYLDKYIADEKTSSRILDTVKKNMEAQGGKAPKEPTKPATKPPANSTQQ